MRASLLLITLSLLFLAGCESTSTKRNPYADTFEQAGIRSILVLPVVNRSVNIYAPGTALSVLPRLLADHGYYVFPVNTVKVVLENEGLYEPAEIYQLPAEKLANMFGADAVLFTTVEQWDTQYVVFSSTTVVSVTFSLTAASGQEIWKAQKTITKSSDSGSQGSGAGVLGALLSDAFAAAWDRAFPDYRPLATEAAQQTFITGRSQIPFGPHHPSRNTQQQP